MHVHDLHLGLQRLPQVAADVHDLHLMPGRIVLDMQGLTRFLDGEISGGRLEIIVVGLPYERRPARMAHPHEQSLAVRLPALEHGTVAVVVEPLCPLGILLHRGRFPKMALKDIVEVLTLWRTLQAEVVLSPGIGLRHQTIRAEEALHALPGRDVLHALLRMELRREVGEVPGRGLQAVRPVTADHVVGRGADIRQLRMERGDSLLQRLLQRRRRITLVAATVERDGGVTADATDDVARVLHEHRLVVGIGSVPGVGQPEVLPDHDAILVAGVIELTVANLSDPVADHVHIHVAVVAHVGIVFASAVSQVGLREPPVAAQRIHAHAIDKEVQALAVAVG